MIALALRRCLSPSKSLPARRGISRWLAAALAVLLALPLLAVSTTDVQAQTRLLVGNTNSGTREAASQAQQDAQEVAHLFRTGNATAGYSLANVEIHFSTAPTATDLSNLTLTIRSPNSNGDAGDVIGTFTNPGTGSAGLNTFTAPAGGIDLDAKATYFLHIAQGTLQNRYSFRGDEGRHDEDSDSLTDWSIENITGTRTSGNNNWVYGGWPVLGFNLNGSVKAPLLVGNTSSGNTGTDGTPYEVAQKFTTGSATAGYSVAYAQIHFSPAPTATDLGNLTLSIRSVSSENANEPGATVIGTFTTPGTGLAGLNTFTAQSGGINLDADTSYFLYINQNNVSTGFSTRRDSGDDSRQGEDSDSLTGWSIANGLTAMIIIPGTSTSLGWNVSSTEVLGFNLNGSVKTVGPAAPTGLSAVPGVGSATLYWTDPGISTIDKYEVRQGTGTTVSWGSWTEITDSDATTTKHTVTGLTNGTEYSFQIRAVVGTTGGAESDTVTATPNTAEATVGFSRTTFTIRESGLNNTPINVQLSAMASDDVMVYVDATDGTATKGEDYPAGTETGPDGTMGRYLVTIPAGNTSATLSIAATDDSDYEGKDDESFNLEIVDIVSDAVIELGSGTQGIVFIDDNDPSVVFSRRSVTVAEPDGTGTYSVKLAAEPTADVMMAVAPLGGSGSVTVAPASLTFDTMNWNTPQEVTVTVVDNDLDQFSGTRNAIIRHTVTSDDEQFILSGSARDVEARVTDDDPTTVTLAGAAGDVDEGSDKEFTVSVGRNIGDGEILVVPLTFGGTATRGTDYTTACPTTLPMGVTCNDLNSVADGNNPRVTFTGPSATSVTLTLSATTDSDTAADGETVDIGLGTLMSTGTGLAGGVSGTDSLDTFSIIDLQVLTASISVDADKAEGGAGTPLADRLRTVTLTLSSAPPSAVPLGVCFSGTAEVGTAAGDDYTPAAVDGTDGDQLSVMSDGCLLTPIEIGAMQTSNTFVLRIAGDDTVEPDETVVLTLQTVSTTPAGITISATDGMATHTILDDDSATDANVTLSVSAASIVEGGSALTLTATRSAANSSGGALDFPLRVKTAGTTAQANDYTALAGTISIANNASTGTTTFAVTDDSTDEPLETVVVELHTPPTGTVLGTTIERTITLVDNDPTSVTLARAGSDAVAEGGTEELTVTLGRDLVAGENVTVPLVVASGMGISGGDFFLADKTGTNLNNGVTLTFGGLTGSVAFTGSDDDSSGTQQVATLTLTANANDPIEADETLSIDFGSVVSNLDRADPSTTGTGGTTTAGAPVEIILSDPGAAVLAPTGLTATAGNAQVTLGWTDPSVSAIDSYEFRRGSGSPLVWQSWTAISSSSATTTSHTVTGLANDTEYSFRVRTVDGSERGAMSATVTATPTAAVTVSIAPAALTVTEGDDTAARLTVSLSGTRSAATEIRLVTFAILASDISDFTPGPITVTIPVGQTEATVDIPIINDTDDESDETFRVQLAAPLLPAGVTLGSPNVATVTIVSDDAPLPAPTALTATAGEGEATLAWTYTPPAVDRTSGFDYRVRAGTAAWGAWTAVPGGDASTRSHTVMGLTNGTAHTFEVRARAGTRTSPASASATATPADTTAPTLGITGVPATIRTTTAFTATFTFSEPVTGFDTNDITVTGGTKGALSGSGATYTMSITPAGGGADVVVTVRVNAATDGSNNGPTAAVSRTATWSSLPTLTISGGSEVTEGGMASFTVTATPTPTSGFIINRNVEDASGSDFVADSEEGDNGSWVFNRGRASRTFTINTVADSTNETSGDITVTLKARNSSYILGTPLSATVRVLDDDGGDDPPAAPTGLMATGADTLVTLSWTDPSNSDITGYEYRQGTGSPVSWDSSWTAITNSDATTTSHIVMGLTNDTEYSFQVRALAGALSSSASATATATPEALDAITISLFGSPQGNSTSGSVIPEGATIGPQNFNLSRRLTDSDPATVRIPLTLGGDAVRGTDYTLSCNTVGVVGLSPGVTCSTPAGEPPTINFDLSTYHT